MKDKVLVLGGKPIGSCEITECANKYAHTIVTDYLLKEESAAKKISNECWNISTADMECLKKKCIEENVTAVLTGVHEFNICKKIELCNELKLPQYCTKEQWDFCEDKQNFKDLCVKYGIDVAKTYDVDAGKIDYPVIVKPVDSSGSRGFSICNNKNELLKGIKFALEFSESKRVLIEEYMQCEACIIHYTAIEGEIIFSGMSDKHSQSFEGGASVMALQIFPSKSIERYLEDVNDKAISMFKGLGIKDGPIWIEVFNDIKNNRFVFNEMGYRFGGSMTNYPVQFFYGIDQMELMVANALGRKIECAVPKSFRPAAERYCILPLHLKAGVISSISGIEETKQTLGIEQIILVHHEGDVIENWGTAQQVFCYLHISFNTVSELLKRIETFIENVNVRDEQGDNMLFCLYDYKKLNSDLGEFV